MAYTKEDYNYFKSKGICVKCRKEKSAEGRVSCWSCLDKDIERKQNKKISKDKKDVALKRNKRKKDLCVAFGVCRNCQKKDVKRGQLCLECWLKNKNKRQAKKTDINRSDRHEYGLCFICGKPVHKEYKLCKEHLNQARSNLCIARSKNTTNTHIWKRQDNAIIAKTIRNIT
ncbi:MAG: hypothetical protein ACRCX2_10825 [Paraclostridium sp.]